MKLPISDLMETCNADAIDIHTESNTEHIKADVLRRIRAEQPPRKKHFKPSVLVAAAAVMTLLIGTAVATTSALSGRELDDTAETVWFSHVNKTDEYQRIHWPDAGYAIDLDIPEDAKSQENIVYYRLNWLPTELNGEPFPTQENTPVITDAEGWTRFDVQTFMDLGAAYGYSEETNIIAYQVNVSTIQQHEYEMVYYLNGDTTLVKQDNWKGWNRMELTVDYSTSDTFRWPQPVNYLLLYDPVENIFVNICGMMDLDTFEKIAENMEIKISDEPYEYALPNAIGSPAGILDLGRG